MSRRRRSGEDEVRDLLSLASAYGRGRIVGYLLFPAFITTFLGVSVAFQGWGWVIAIVLAGHAVLFLRWWIRYLSGGEGDEEEEAEYGVVNTFVPRLMREVALPVGVIVFWGGTVLAWFLSILASRESAWTEISVWWGIVGFCIGVFWLWRTLHSDADEEEEEPE